MSSPLPPRGDAPDGFGRHGRLHGHRPGHRALRERARLRLGHGRRGRSRATVTIANGGTRVADARHDHRRRRRSRSPRARATATIDAGRELRRCGQLPADRRRCRRRHADGGLRRRRPRGRPQRDRRRRADDGHAPNRRVAAAEREDDVHGLDPESGNGPTTVTVPLQCRTASPARSTAASSSRPRTWPRAAGRAARPSTDPDRRPLRWRARRPGQGARDQAQALARVHQGRPEAWHPLDPRDADRQHVLRRRHQGHAREGRLIRIPKAPVKRRPPRSRLRASPADASGVRRPVRSP